MSVLHAGNGAASNKDNASPMSDLLGRLVCFPPRPHPSPAAHAASNTITLIAGEGLGYCYRSLDDDDDDLSTERGKLSGGQHN